MAASKGTVGIIGGSGQLGSAIATALLSRDAVAPQDLWIANRSGRAPETGGPAAANITADNQALADACEVIILSVPPANVGQIDIEAGDALVVSVMAGVSLARIRDLTGAARVVRAMSSPAAAHGLAFSPWCADEAVTDADRARLMQIFGACGTTAEVPSEDQVECFTALTGPVPGFVAFFAECMANYAVGKGVAPEIADQAIRQLFLAAGRIMGSGAETPADHVRLMIDYAGTTAAGLTALKASSIERDLAAGLDAAVAKTRAMG